MPIPPIHRPSKSGGGSEVPPELLQSPFAKMFEKAGMSPTVEEIKKFITQVIKDQLQAIQKQAASWKRSMEKLKKATEDDDS